MTFEQNLFLAIFLGMFGLGGLIGLISDARRARRFYREQEACRSTHPGKACPRCSLDLVWK